MYLALSQIAVFYEVYVLSEYGDPLPVTPALAARFSPKMRKMNSTTCYFSTVFAFSCSSVPTQ